MVNDSSFGFILTPSSRAEGFSFVDRSSDFGVGRVCGMCGSQCVMSCMSSFCCATFSWYCCSAMPATKTCETSLPFFPFFFWLFKKLSLAPAVKLDFRLFLSMLYFLIFTQAHLKGFEESIKIRFFNVLPMWFRCVGRALKAAVTSTAGCFPLQQHPKTIANSYC